MKLKTLGNLALVGLIVVGTFTGWVLGRLSAFRTPEGPPDTCEEADALRWVEHANLQEDFRQHVVGERDMRFLSMFGLSFSTEFPGLQDTPEMQRLVQEHGSRRLEGTTDIWNCIEQKQLHSDVFGYATRYNSMILGYRECPK